MYISILSLFLLFVCKFSVSVSTCLLFSDWTLIQIVERWLRQRSPHATLEFPAQENSPSSTSIERCRWQTVSCWSVTSYRKVCSGMNRCLTISRSCLSYLATEYLAARLLTVVLASSSEITRPWTSGPIFFPPSIFATSRTVHGWTMMCGTTRTHGLWLCIWLGCASFR